MFCGRELLPKPRAGEEGGDLRVVVELRALGQGSDLDFAPLHFSAEGGGRGDVGGGEGGVEHYGPGRAEDGREVED